MEAPRDGAFLSRSSTRAEACANAPGMTGFGDAARFCACAAAGIAVLFASASCAAPAATAHPECHRSEAGLVVMRERVGAMGTEIYVRAAVDAPAKDPCLFAPKDSDWIISRTEPVYFLAFQGRFLALDFGTGSRRQILIYDVADRKKVLESVYDDAPGKFAASPGAIVYWRVGDDPVKPDACPASWRANKDHRNAKQAHPTHEVRFSVSDGQPHDTGKTGCVLTDDDL